MKKIVALLLLAGLYCLPALPQKYSLKFDDSSPMLRFGAGEIESSLQKGGLSGKNITIELNKNPELSSQSYRILFPEPGMIMVEGGDDAGTMYGSLRLAELINLYGLDGFDEEAKSPYILKRGLKMDITLDARTLGYDDSGDSGQKNISDVWDFGFWRHFLDDMALYQYNELTIWHPNPFPAMLALKKYPGIAMEDVYRTTRMWPDSVHPRYAAEDAMDHAELVKSMNMEEKIQLWQRIMRYAKDRGIDIIFITWNIHVDGARGKYNIDTRQNNENTIEFMHDCVKEFVDTYPDLAGLGTTAGEMMEDRQDRYAREKWLWRTYGQGIVDALADQPERKFLFIHRVWESGMKSIMDDFGSKFPYDFDVSYKYARGRMYSDPNPPFANELLNEMRTYGIKSWWNVRNDDLYTYRWGDPEFARSFIRNMPLIRTAGYHMGSDGYFLGKKLFYP